MQMKWVYALSGAAAIILAVLVAAVALRGRGQEDSIGSALPTAVFQGSPVATQLPTAAGQPLHTATAVPLYTPTALSHRTPTALQGEPTEELGAIPSPTGAVSPTVPGTAEPGLPSSEEAEGVIRTYFAGIDTDAYDRARAVTTGSARQKTDQLIAEVEREEAAQGLDVDLRVVELSLSPYPPLGDQRPVRVRSVVHAYADAGVALIKVREIRTDGLFMVRRADGGTKIVDIGDDLSR